MRRAPVVVGVLALAATLLVAVPDEPGTTPTVVRLRDTGALTRLPPVRAVIAADTFVVDLPADRRLGGDPAVHWAEPDVGYRAARQPSDPCWIFCPAALRGAEGLRAVHAAEAWDATTGTPDVVVAVLDTAVEATHPDLLGKVEVGPDLVSDGCEEAVDPMTRTHGTGVAGMVAARTDNGRGVAALGWSTTVLAIRVLDDCGWGPASAVAAGVRRAIAAGVDVINLSVTGPPHVAVAEALVAAHRAGIVVVAAAGNDGGTGAVFPAAYPDVIGVGATDPGGTAWAPFSNRSPWVDVAAPGMAMPSTSTLPGGYWMFDGTSFAAPLVAGAIALLLAVHPHFDPDDVAAALARSSTRSAGPRLLDAAELVTAHRGGAWVATANGGVRTYGDAPFYGSAAALRLRRPIVGIASVRGGYFLASADGGVFAFGRARFAGSLAGSRLQADVVGIAATPSGAGYWLLAADGGVFAFGDAPFAGSGAGKTGAPATAIAASPTGRGYAILTRDGAVRTFGDATGGGAVPGPAIALAGAGPGAFWVAGTDGTVQGLGTAPDLGSADGVASTPVVGLAAPDGHGYWLVTADGRPLAFGDVVDDGRLLPRASNVVGIAAAR